MKPARILYCRCAYAQVVPAEVKNAVLEKLCDSGLPFESVADLCEMSARRDPRLHSLLGDEGEQTVRIAACHPRAVEWLFHAAGAPFPSHDEGEGEGEGEENTPQVEVLNMREQSADDIFKRLKTTEAEAG